MGDPEPGGAAGAGPDGGYRGGGNVLPQWGFRKGLGGGDEVAGVCGGKRWYSPGEDFDSSSKVIGLKKKKEKNF